MAGPYNTEVAFFTGRETWLLSAVAVAPTATFCVDISTNLMYVGGVLPYFLAVFGCLWTGGRRGLVFVTSLSIVFLVVGTIAKHPMPDVFYINRATLVVGLIIAALVTDRAIAFKFQAISMVPEAVTRDDRVGNSMSPALIGVEAANIGLWEWNVARGTLVITRKLEEMLGCSPDERITTFADWKSRVDRLGGATQERISQAFLAGTHDGFFNAEYYVDLPDGRRRHFVTRAMPMLDENGAQIGLVGADMDMTDLRELTEELKGARDAAEAANRTKSFFLANMSHELRTPLNSIIGFSQVMEGQLLGPMEGKRYAGYATDIREAGEHLLGVINDILDISRIESGEVNADPQVISMVEMSETIIRFCQPAAEKVGVALKGPSLDNDVRLRADPRHILQIGVNLVSNAVKFSPVGGQVDIRIETTSDRWVKLSVIDAGPGIASENMERAFEPFQQLSDTLSREYQGMGLGLAIARSLAKTHGGSLHLESTLGEGTSAILTLPLCDDDLV